MSALPTDKNHINLYHYEPKEELHYERPIAIFQVLLAFTSSKYLTSIDTSTGESVGKR